jgi:RecB family exonuclease
MGIGLDLDLVVVLGLAEGTFPAPVHDDSLLPDHERRAAGDELPLRQARVEREHRQLLATMAGASAHVLGVPRGDLRRSTERVPSRWVLDIASRLAGDRWWTEELLGAREPWIEHGASFEAGVRGLEFPATEQEHHLRTLMVAAPADALALAGATHDERVARAATVLAARRSAAFTRFDGNLSGLVLRSPIDTTSSATRLERWAGCPFRYLVHDVLRVEPVDNPEERLQISPLDRGTLVHTALEEFIVEVLARPEAQRPQPDEPWSASDRERLAAIGERLCDEYETRGLTGRPIFWRRDRASILADLDRFLTADDSNRRQVRTRPIAAELAFGPGASLDAVSLALPDGRRLRFVGKADRIDLADDGTLHIVDYKTGRHDDYNRLSEDNPDDSGLKLQLAVYGAAARAHHRSPHAPVHAEYWFVTQKGRFQRRGYAVTDDVLARVGATLHTIVSGIEAGVFPPHPTASSTSFFVECEACDPDGLGVVELRRAWERKRHDPLVAPYAHLAEPLAEAEVEVDEQELTDVS